MASADGNAADWLVLTYQLPAKPTSLKVTVRKKLTAAGAVYLSSACAVAPLSSPAERAMRRMRATISRAGGSAVLLSGCALAGEPDLTGAFNAIQDREYEDIIGGCRDAVGDLETLTEACEFCYQQLWDKDIGLRQLSARYRAVQGRDLFGARQAQATASALAGYRSALNHYARRVYAADSWPRPDARRASAAMSRELPGTGANQQRGQRPADQARSVT
jgi:hypothetical protein